MAKKALFLTALLAACFLAPLAAQNFHVYISDAGGFQNPPWKIFKFDENGANGEIFISDHLAWPQDILFCSKATFFAVSTSAMRWAVKWLSIIIDFGVKKGNS